MHTVFATIFLTAIVVMLVFSVVYWRLHSESIYAGNGVIIKKQGTQVLTIQIDQLNTINFSFQATVGFNGIWEFIDENGKIITADYETTGVTSTLKGLEASLPHFSLAHFRQKYKVDNIEGTLTVWSRY